MANADIVAGFRPVGSISASDYNGKTERCIVASTDVTPVFVGDLVKFTGDVDSTDGVTKVVTQAAASGTLILGAVVRVEYNPNAMGTLYRPASTRQYVHVACDPNQEFWVQEDSVGGAIASSDAGKNVDFIVGSGDTYNGMSGMEIDSNTVGTTDTLPIKLIRPDFSSDNAIGTNCKWIVKINNHCYGNVTDGIA